MQEDYCKNRILKKMSQRKAYRAAFPSSEKWKDSTVDEKACRLETQDKILTRLQELKDEQTALIHKENKWTRDNTLSELKWLIDKAKEEIERTGEMTGANVSAITNSVKELDAIFEVMAETVEHEQNGFVEALSGEACEVWDNEENSDIPV
jgi:hypothetical protein